MSLHQDLIGKFYGKSVDEILAAIQFATVFVIANAEAQESGAGEELFKAFAQTVNNQMRGEIEATAARLRAKANEKPE